MVKRLVISCIILLTWHIGYSQTEWSSFKWGHDSITVNTQKAFVPRSALFLPVSFDGDPRRYYMQLDLTSDVPLLLYATPISIDNKEVAQKAYDTNALNKCFRINTQLKGRVGSDTFSLSTANYCLMRRKTDTTTNYNMPSTASPIIGTIGLSYFLKKILILDFTHEQFILIGDTGKLPFRFSKAKFYVPSHINNSRYVVPIEYGDTTFNDFFYETGSSIFDMMVSKKLWCKMTGKTGSEPENFKVTVNAWGHQLTAIGAHPKIAIRINNTYLPTALVFYLPNDEDFKDTYGSNGMLGNSPFYSKVIVLDFLRNRFGLFSAL